MFLNAYDYITIWGWLIALIFVCIAWSWVPIVVIKHKQRNKISSLVVTSKLRSISEIARHARMSEDKVIKILRKLISSSAHSETGEKKYLKNATLNLQTMEVILSDKYTEKEPWACVYCRAVNKPKDLVCQSCQAAKKKL